MHDGNLLELLIYLLKMIIFIKPIKAMRNFEVAKILIEKGADVNAQNKREETPLFEGLFYLIILKWFLVTTAL